jgi:hypothetical protein
MTLAALQLSSNTNCFVTPNPSLAVTDVTAPASNSVRYDIYLMAIASTGLSTAKPAFDVKIPVSKGETLYVVAAAQTSATLYFE